MARRAPSSFEYSRRILRVRVTTMSNQQTSGPLTFWRISREDPVFSALSVENTDCQRDRARKCEKIIYGRAPLRGSLSDRQIDLSSPPAYFRLSRKEVTSGVGEQRTSLWPSLCSRERKSETSFSPLSPPLLERIQQCVFIVANLFSSTNVFYLSI